MPEPLHADLVARKDFPVGFRGFDQHEVRAFLGQVGAELAALQVREQELRARVAQLEAVPPPEFDEMALEAALGREATKVIHAAREAAAEIRSRAEDDATTRTAALSGLEATRRAEAEDAAAALLADAEHQATVMLDDARARATALLGDATSERDRVLDHLAATKRAIVAELDELHHKRERLVGSFDAVRLALDSAVTEVADADDVVVDVVVDAVETEVVVATPVFEPRPAPEPAAVVEPEADPGPEPVADAEAEPEPDAEPVSDADPDDRRSSSVRLLRRTEPSIPAPPSSDPVERVRIILPEPEPEVAAEPEPEPEPEVAAEPEPEPAAIDGDDAKPSTILFARLREERAKTVASAVAVLAAVPSDDEPEAAPEPTPATAVATGTAAQAASPDLALLAARDDAVVDAERGVVRSLKRALADEQNEVLDALRRLRGAPTLVALLPAAAEHDARFDAVLSGGAAAAAEAAGVITGGSGRGGGDKVATDLGRSVAADIRIRLGRAIEESSGDVETLAEAISAAYREWKTARAEPLARDVIVAAFASGLYASASGDLRWIVDPAEGGCPDCDDNALAGPTVKGAPFPTGQLHPPAHAGCRCVVVPVS